MNNEQVRMLVVLPDSVIDDHNRSFMRSQLHKSALWAPTKEGKDTIIEAFLELNKFQMKVRKGEDRKPSNHSNA